MLRGSSRPVGGPEGADETNSACSSPPADKGHPEVNKQRAAVYLALGVLNEVLEEDRIHDHLQERKKRSVLMFDESDSVAGVKYCITPKPSRASMNVSAPFAVVHRRHSRKAEPRPDGF
jgi:hypothetical protein